MDDQEPDFLDDTEIKPKKQLSEQKLQHLANIRIKALEKKKEMKEITEKINKLKEIESLKQAKQIQREQLAKQYDEMIEKAKPKEVQPQGGREEIKPEVKPKEVEVKPKEFETKPIKKKKIIKKVVYQEASSSDSDDADEVEVVKVKKQSKNKIIPVEKPPPPQQQPVVNNSYSNLLYEASVDKLKNRFMEERARNLVMSVMPNYG